MFAVCSFDSKTAASQGEMFIYASPQRGHIGLIRFSADASTAALSGRIYSAHNGAIAALALSPNGRFYATASDKGTLIRIFDVHTGRLLHELRRGTERTVIWSIVFSPDSSKVAVTSDKGTLHIFQLAPEGGPKGSLPTSAPISTINEYLNSIRSFAQYPVGEAKSIATFHPHSNTIYGTTLMLSLNVFR